MSNIHGKHVQSVKTWRNLVRGIVFFGKYCVSYGRFWNNCPIIIAIWWWDEQTCLQRRTRFVWTSVASFSKVAFFCVKMGFLGVLIYRHVPSDLSFRCLDYYISWNLFVLRALGGVNVWTLSQLNILQMHPVRMFWWIWKAEEEKALTTWRTFIQETSFWAFVKKIGLALGQCFFILSLAMLITQLMRRGVGGLGGDQCNNMIIQPPLLKIETVHLIKN